MDLTFFVFPLNAIRNSAFSQIVELDAQPNNVHREINGLGPRSKTTLVGDYHYQNRHNYAFSGPQNGVQNGPAVVAGAASLRDLSGNLSRAPLLSGPGADVLFGDRAQAAPTPVAAATAAAAAAATATRRTKSPEQK